MQQGIDIYGTYEFSFDFLENSDFEIKMENDGRCFAWGEYIFGKGAGVKNLLTLTLGTEVGGGFINENTCLNGFNNSAMEISHVKISSSDKINSFTSPLVFDPSLAS